MEFTDKNDFTVKYTSKDHFDKDLELFRKYCPNSKLHSDLRRVNSFNRRKLDGYMLWELLDKISLHEILTNREVSGNRPEAATKPPVPPADPIHPENEFVSADTHPEDETEPATHPVPESDPGTPAETPESHTEESTETPAEETPAPPIDLSSADEKLKELAKRIDYLEENVGVNESDIDYLREELNDKDASIEELERKIAELEANPPVKKKE